MINKWIVSGTLFGLLILSTQHLYSQPASCSDLKRDEIFSHIKSNWSDFDTVLVNNIILERTIVENMNKDQAVKEEARFSFFPGFVHRFYLNTSNDGEFKCKLCLYMFHENMGVPNTLVRCIDNYVEGKTMQYFDYKIDTKQEMLLVLEISSFVPGCAVAVATTQIPENDSIRKFIFERNKRLQNR